MTVPTLQPATQQHAIPVDLSGSTRAALVLFTILIGFVVLWSIFAELHVGALAMGEVTPFGRSKIVQHLEGGIVREIIVRDGDAVKEGQELIILNDGEARAAVAIGETERSARAALVERLVAERDGASYKVRGINSPAIQAQVRLFELRRQSLLKELASLSSRGIELRKELVAWQKKTDALSNLMGYAEDERRINQDLYDKNFISKSRLLALDSRSSETRANMSESEAEMARAKQRLGDTELQIAKLKNDWMNSVLEDLRKAQDELAVATERLQVANERLARTRVTAPQSGIVKGLRTMTLGAVIPAGGTLLEVVPVDDRMIVEARVMPDDVDVVVAGTRCRLRLTAYKARAHLRLGGVVRSVSADAFKDEKSGLSYYLARIEVTDDKARTEAKLPMQPGMQVEVELIGSARSPLRYLFDPIVQSFSRAFKEE
jgi:HlyD family secretion protein/epimerase transport system membrane fusion protein